MSSKFLGDTKGNRDLSVCRDLDDIGGSGESHASGPSGKFLGATKGNTDLPIDRTAGVVSGPRRVAGGGGSTSNGIKTNKTAY